MPSKFPTRTVVLMVLTLLSFIWFWVQTHRTLAPPPPSTPHVILVPLGGGDQ